MKKTTELTEEQIQVIKKYLKFKKLNYIDLYIETVDHIASDIENLMDEKAYNFEEAFAEIKLKWNFFLEEITNGWFGFATFKPAILIKNSLKIYIPLLLKSLLVVVLITLLVGIFSENIGKLIHSSISNLSNIISGAALIYCCIVIYWFIRIKLTNFKSTFSFVFIKRIVSNIINAIFFFMVFNNSNNYLGPDFKINLAMFGLFVFLLTSLVVGYFLYKKHIQSVKLFKSII